jgi:hypothetical protein
VQVVLPKRLDIEACTGKPGTSRIAPLQRGRQARRLVRRGQHFQGGNQLHSSNMENLAGNIKCALRPALSLRCLKAAVPADAKSMAEPIKPEVDQYELAAITRDIIKMLDILPATQARIIVFVLMIHLGMTLPTEEDNGPETN